MDMYSIEGLIPPLFYCLIAQLQWHSLTMTSNNTKELKECQQLCKDLDYLIIQDSSIREEIIDEYVYLLSNRRIEEMQGYVNTELGSDY